MTDVCAIVQNAASRVDPFVFHMLEFAGCLVLGAVAALGIELIIEKVGDRHE